MGSASSKKVRKQDTTRDNQSNSQLTHLYLRPRATEDSGEPSATPCLRPTVLCFHGSGHGPHQESWLAVIKGVAAFAPILYYDRRGMGTLSQRETSLMGVTSSPSAPINQTPQDAVKDLRRLLETLGLHPPFILVAHSYGGTIARTFLQLHKSHVAGMVLAETGQETPTPYDEEQYRQKIMGDNPVSVIHAVPMVASTDGEGGSWSSNSSSVGGIGAQRAAAHDQGDERRMQRMWAEEDERLKKAQLRLSSNARYVRVDGCGHHVVRDRPDIVVEEVKWVLEDVLRSGCEASGSSELRKWNEGAVRWPTRG